jgi:hypothetical protein
MGMLATASRSVQSETEGGAMKLYRIDKLTKPGGDVVKKRHVLAENDRKAEEDARDSDDCPVCDVLRDGKKVGEIY